jgi:thiamine biosynthesis lipoprotein
MIGTLAVLLAATGLACANPATEPAARALPLSDGRYAMGTVLEIALYDADPALLSRAFARAAELDAMLTRFDPESDLSRLNARAGAGPQSVPADLSQLLDDSIGYSRLTGGTFDVTVGSLLELWRTGATRGVRPTAHAISQRLTRIGPGHFRSDPRARTAELDAGVAIDLGGVAKGFALDRMAEELTAAGITRALLNFGQSSICALGAPPGTAGWRLLLRDGAGGVAGAIELHDTSLSVSGSLGQGFEIAGVQYGHVIDPRSGEPLARRAVAAVIASSGARAEALSKALLVLDPAAGLALLERLPDAEGLVIASSGELRASSGWALATRFQPEYDTR